MSKWLPYVLITALIAPGLYWLLKPSQNETLSDLIYSTESPSGRWRAEEYQVGVYAGFIFSTWNELRLTDTRREGSMKTVLGYTQSQIKLKWLDDLTLQVTVEGKIYIGQRANIIEEIEVPILFAGEDATARRLRLIEIKESKQNWWMYDIPTD